MPTRREALRTLSLAALAVGAARLLSGCGDDARPAEDTVTDLQPVSSDVERTAADPAAIPPAAASLHALGAGLVATTWREPGNAALSPYSLGVALGMTVVGARGETERSMLDVLAADDAGTLARGLNALTAYVEGLAGPVKVLGETEELVLAAANSLFGQQGTPWEQTFLDTLAREYGAGLQAVDYASAAESAHGLINTWTAEQTRDRIEEIVPSGALTALTRLVLVNTLYLKAPWAVPFEASLTEDGDFHRADGSVVRVPMMRAPSYATATGAGDGWRSARLPYGGGALAMTIVLPADGRLPDVEASVADGGLADVLAATDRAGTVALTLPRWTFRTGAALQGALSELGMADAFTPAADFSGMTTAETLRIDEVLHEVFVAVDESGTEAAAATAVVMRATSIPVEAASFVVDRPFLFAIHDTEHGTPLLVGRVADPSAP